MSQLIRKQHNVNILLYHIVCPAKYRKAVFTWEVDEKLREICAEIALRYEIEFLEIGTDHDHVHFLVQSAPSYSPTKIVRTIKSITAKEIFRLDAGSEKTAVGRRVLVVQLFHQHGRFAYNRRRDKAVCQRSKQLKRKYSTSPVLIPRGSARGVFILSGWGFISVFDNACRVGVAAVAWKISGVEILEERDDTACLWDLRVHPNYRRQGMGQQSFNRAADWARTRNCSQLKIETERNPAKNGLRRVKMLISNSWNFGN